jgi:thiol-disulfide isomerase/thioredoxin
MIMKLKNIAAVLLSALLFASVGSFAACSGNGNSAPDGSQSNSDNGSNSDTLSNGSSNGSSKTPDDKDTAVKSLSSTSYNFDAEYYYDDYNTLSEGSSLQNYSTTFENKEIVFQAVTWEELVYLFEQEGNYLILFGGSWCPNTRASAPYINDYAKEYGITTIYNFDFRLDGENSSSHIRVSDGDSGLAAGYNYLYGELVSRYITNLNDWVEYKEGSNSSLTYTNSDGEEVNVAKVQVPFLFLYNKNNTKHYKPVYDENGKQTGAEEDTSATGNYPIVYGFEEMIQKDDQGVYEGSNYNRETGDTTIRLILPRNIRQG